MSTSANGVIPPNFAPSAGPYKMSTFTDSLWRWSKSSAEVWCGGSLAVHAMLRCVLETDPVPFADERL